MTTTMSGVEFLRKTKKIKQRAERILVAAPCLIVLITAATIHHFYPQTWSTGTALDYAFGAGAAAFLGILGWHKWWTARSTKAHPKMKCLDVWIETMGSADNYPTNPDEELAVIPETGKKLEGLGVAANIARTLRNRIEVAMLLYPDGSEEKLLLTEFYNFAMQSHDCANKRYMQAWDLLTHELNILRGPDYEDAIEYRKMLLKEKAVDM